MSNVSTAYDALKARLATLLPSVSGYSQLTNPYDVVDNNAQFLRKGWGLAVGPAQNTNRNLCGTISVERQFRVVLTEALEALEFGIDDKHDTVKSLLESAQIVIEDFERTYKLDSDQFNCLWQSDSGINSVEGDDFTFLTLELTFNVEIFDNP